MDHIHVNLVTPSFHIIVIRTLRWWSNCFKMCLTMLWTRGFKTVRNTYRRSFLCTFASVQVWIATTKARIKETKSWFTKSHPERLIWKFRKICWRTFLPVEQDVSLKAKKFGGKRVSRNSKEVSKIFRNNNQKYWKAKCSRNFID